MVKRLIAVLLLTAAPAFGAVGEICGDGIDNDASGGDAACAEPDKDRDGYPSSSAYTGPYGSAVDCDDTNRDIYPGNGGRYVNVGAGTYKTCQTDGTYTGTLNLSAFTCHTGSGGTYWFDDTGNNATGSGTFAAPWRDYVCISNSGAGCYHAPVAGDCFVFRSGSYNGTWSDAGTTRMLYVNNKDGTSSNHITIMEAPGEVADIAGTGTTPTEVRPAYILLSDYVDFFGIDVHGGYSAAGVWVAESANNEVAGLSTYNIDGDNTGNVGVIKATGVGSGPLSIHHMKTYDNYDRANSTAENNYGVVIMDLASVSITDSVGYNTTTGIGSHIFAIKHGYSGGSGTFKRNVCFRGERSCFVFEQPNTTITNNYAEEVGGNNSSNTFEYRYLGNGPIYDSGVIQYNTINKAPFFELINAAGTIGASSVLNAQYNVVLDNRGTSYTADGTDGFIRIGYYGFDSEYTDIVDGGKLTINNNCYYNSAATALFFTLFGATSGGYGDGSNGTKGADYASFAAWQAKYDAASYSENPTFNSDGGATSTNCSTKGWNKNIFTDAAPTSTGTTSSGRGFVLPKRRTRG